MALRRPALGDGALKIMTISIDQITKTFDTSSALNGVSLEIADGTFVALLGPSGSGKTTLLRIIAGLETADAGHILFRGEDVTDRSVQDRRIGFVFQHYALFRHMTVAENVAFGLTVMKGKARPKKAAIAARVQELLDLVQLPDLGKRFPSQLSGGQRQRVALARALAREPDILLLDEPFGALDAKVRRELRVALREIHDRVGLTSIFVTHDREEAFALADKVAILSNGRIEQYDTPRQVEENPATPFVHDFVI
ncbi:sulfate/molybdate ABC transporter ATP-binding protein [Sphingomonas oryzagri]